MTASSGKRGRDAVEDCGALKVALGSMEDSGGNLEEEDIVVADVVDIIVDVVKVKVDEVEETGADKKESSIWLRVGYASVENVFKICLKCVCVVL